MTTEERLREIKNGPISLLYNHEMQVIGNSQALAIECLKLKEVLTGIEILPDPNGGMQLCIKARGGFYRLRLGEITLTETLTEWSKFREEVLK